MRVTNGGAAPGPSDAVAVVCAADDRFAMPLGVTLYSVVVNYRGAVPLRVFIVDGGVSANKRARINRILARHGVVPEWLEGDCSSVQHLPVNQFYPQSVYLRLLLPRLLPASLEKAIYLDSDVIVEADVGELWETTLGDNDLLAVRDEGCPTLGSPLGLPNCAELGVDPASPYFNSGVMVLNLERWRRNGTADRVIEYLRSCRYPMRFGEQDAMNAVLANRWGELDGRWNQLVTPWEGNDGRAYQHGVLHFVSIFKPWLPVGAHVSNGAFDGYLRRSHWYGCLEWFRHMTVLRLRRKLVLYLRTRARRAAREAQRARSRAADAPARAPLPCGPEAAAPPARLP